MDSCRKQDEGGVEDLRVIVLGNHIEPEVRQVKLHHPPAPSSVNWDDDLDDFMPPKPWPPRPDVPPLVHESRTIKERKGKSRGSSSQTAPPPAPSSVNWDDDLDDFMPPPNYGLQEMT